MASLLSRFRDGLSKTAQQIRERLGGAETAPVGAGGSGARATAAPGKPLAIETIDALEDALLTADVGLPATERILGAVRADRDGTLRDRVGRVMKQILTDVRPAPAITTTPHVVLIVGVNGTGKTTTVGKLANYYRQTGRSVLVCAADTFRAAAVDQLATWGERVGVEVVRGPEGSDPASVAFEAVKHGVDNGVDTVLVDTAGRLQNKAGLMDELGKVKRVIEKQAPVTEVLLVLDATTGQNGLIQARVFSEIVDVTGIVLTKLDGSAKGGIVVQVQRELGVPVKLVGLGEGADDMAPFDPAAFVDALLG
jgi:fused signal recognition particle receptor